MNKSQIAHKLMNRSSLGVLIKEGTDGSDKLAYNHSALIEMTHYQLDKQSILF